MKEYRVFPYIFRNSAFMSNMSISALATIVLIRTLSVVPSPCRHTDTAFTRRFIQLRYLPISFACVKDLPSWICTSALQRRPACSGGISLQGNNKDSLYQEHTSATSLWGSVVQQRRTYGQEDVFQRAGHLPLNAVLDVFSGNLSILVKHWRKKRYLHSSSFLQAGSVMTCGGYLEEDVSGSSHTEPWGTWPRPCPIGPRQPRRFPEVTHTNKAIKKVQSETCGRVKRLLPWRPQQLEPRPPRHFHHGQPVKQQK